MLNLLDAKEVVKKIVASFDKQQLAETSENP